MLLAVLMAPLGCGDSGTRSGGAAAKADPASRSETPVSAEGTGKTPSEAITPKSSGPTTPPASAESTVTVEVDGQARAFKIAEAGHATINRLSNPPLMAIIASATGSKEKVMLKFGGFDIDGATLPLDLRNLDVGGPSVAFTYIDPGGARHIGQVDQRSPHSWLTIEAWDRENTRVTGRFATEVGPRDARVSLAGSFDAVLYDAFGNR